MTETKSNGRKPDMIAAFYSAAKQHPAFIRLDDRFASLYGMAPNADERSTVADMYAGTIITEAQRIKEAVLEGDATQVGKAGPYVEQRVINLASVLAEKSDPFPKELSEFFRSAALEFMVAGDNKIEEVFDKSPDHAASINQIHEATAHLKAGEAFFVKMATKTNQPPKP